MYPHPTFLALVRGIAGSSPHRWGEGLLGTWGRGGMHGVMRAGLSARCIHRFTTRQAKMPKATMLAAMLGLLLLYTAHPAPLRAADLQPSILSSQIIKQLSALDQGNTHFLHLSFEIEDVQKPRINTESLRYSLRLGSLQWVSDVQFSLEPKKTFNHIESRLKLRAFDLPAVRTAVALGILGRFIEKSEERKQRIDNKTSSLFLIITTELFPFGNWGGVLFNATWDNRVAGVGARLQLFRNLRLVVEHDNFHAADTLPASNRHKNPSITRAGFEFEGAESLAVQLLWSDEARHVWLLTAFSF